MAATTASAVFGGCTLLLSIIVKIKPLLENLPPTLKGRLQNLSRKMREIHDKLGQAKIPGTDPNHWQREIKGVEDDVKNLLDDFEIEESRSKVHNFFSNLPDRDIIGEFKEDLGNLNKTLLDLITKSVAHEKWTEETSSTFAGGDFIGRGVEMKKIVGFLSSKNNNDNNSTCSIVGMGGVGKTALAQVICQDKIVKERLVVKWAHVGFKFDLSEILFRLGIGEKIDTLEMQKRKLPSWTETCLFVLDDLWDINPDRWQELKSMLLNINKGNKFLITTRHQRIAEIAAAKDKTVFLKPLEPSECLPLIEKHVVKSKLLSPEIREEIIKECEGVPMAAITLGRKLSKKTSRVSDIWWTVDVKETGNIMNSLKFSYDYLPLKLKDCFAYHVVCNNILHKERLTQMWTAQGFIEEPELVDNYFEELKHASFFHDVTKDVFTGTQFKILKLFRALILLVSEEYADTTLFRITGVTRHVSLSSQSHAKKIQESHLRGQFRTLVGLPEITLLSHFKGLRVLILFDVEFGSEVIPFSDLKYLRYLDLSKNGNLEVLPESLGQLLFLETLRVDRCEKLKALLPNEAKKMSYFSKLQTLEILDCRCLRFEESDMENLKNLKRLVIIKHLDLTNLRKGFHRLTSLERLSIEGCSGLESSLSTVDGRNILPYNLKSIRMKRSDELTEIYKRGEDAVKSWTIKVYVNGVPNPVDVEPSPSSSSGETADLPEGSNGGTTTVEETVRKETIASTVVPLTVSGTSSTQQSLESCQNSVAGLPNGNGEGSSTHPHQSDGTPIGKSFKVTNEAERHLCLDLSPYL